MIIALCCGGRDFSDVSMLNARLTEFREKYGDFAILHGGARGADKLCGNWGISKGLPVAIVDANWNFYGSVAGALRNKWMLEIFKPDVGIAFPGGFGTRNMISQLNAANVPVWRLV